jgi:ArsR family metal-binding transcriptional regulator
VVAGKSFRRVFRFRVKNYRPMVKNQKICIAWHEALVQKLNIKRYIPTTNCRICGAIRPRNLVA